MSSRRGHQRERQVKKLLEEQGWFVVRAAGSLGDVDLLAMKAGARSRLIEVKSTAAGPFHSFGPKDRREILDAAERAGADPLLYFWPPRKPLEIIPASAWPAIQPSS